MNNITSREREVLQCLATGLTNGETAKELNLSVETIKSHRRNLMLKLDVKNAFQLGMLSIELALIDTCVIDKKHLDLKVA